MYIKIIPNFFNPHSHIYYLTISITEAENRKSDKIKSSMPKKSPIEATTETSGEYYDGRAKSESGSIEQGYQYTEVQQYAA